MSGGSGDSTWSISTSGVATFNRILANKGGSIGGWTIGEHTLSGEDSGGKITMDARGSISASNWSINRNGRATFSDVVITSASGKQSTIGGVNIGAGLRSVNFSDTAGFDINSSGAATFRNITANGAITATSGKIGNVSISGGALTSANEHFKVSAAGDLTCENATVKGNITATKFAFGSGKNSFYLDSDHTYPTAGGLNVGNGGIVVDGGIKCTNIGADSGTMELRGPVSSNNFTISGSAAMKVGDRTLSEYVNDVVKSYKAKGTINCPKDGGEVSVELSLS
jgi:hypothetical protein